jgi:hypothetical protein
MLGLAFLALLAAAPEDAYDAQGEDIIPSLFQGKWAPAVADCKDEDQVAVLNISKNHVQGYEFDARLLKHAGLQVESAPATGKLVQVITLLVAESGEGEVSLGRIRLGLYGGKMYFDRPSEKAGALNTKGDGYIHCPAKTR